MCSKGFFMRCSVSKVEEGGAIAVGDRLPAYNARSIGPPRRSQIEYGECDAPGDVEQEAERRAEIEKTRGGNTSSQLHFFPPLSGTAARFCPTQPHSILYSGYEAEGAVVLFGE